MNILCSSKTEPVLVLVRYGNECRYTPIAILHNHGWSEKDADALMYPLVDILRRHADAYFSGELLPETIGGPNAYSAMMGKEAGP